MAERLDGTVALITGASSGIGEATARALAAQGAAVALAARRKDRLEQLAEAIRGNGGQALVIETDVIDKTQAQAAIERTVAELGRLDTLVNNAGVMLLGPVEGAPLEEWDRMVQLNVLGLLYVAHAALPHLLKAAEDSSRRVADMVNISSVAGRVARAGVAAMMSPSLAWLPSAKRCARKSPNGMCASQWSSLGQWQPSCQPISDRKSSNSPCNASLALKQWPPRTLLMLFNTL